MAKRTQRAPIRPISTHGKISHIVSPSDVRSETAVKNFCSQLLFAMLCRDAERPIHTAAIEKAAIVIRPCRVVYLLKSTAFSCIRSKWATKDMDEEECNLGNTDKTKNLNHAADIADCGKNPTSKRRSWSTDDCIVSF
jgi:hypothetical protein